MINDTVELLKNSNIKPSYARIRIFEYLRQQKSHPPADEIYTVLVKEIPTLSRTTVYNTLALFTENRVLKSLSIKDTEKRYDDNIEDHGHFICKECGRIYDFSVDTKNIGSDELNEFSIDEKNVFFKGTCKKCKNKI